MSSLPFGVTLRPLDVTNATDLDAAFAVASACELESIGWTDETPESVRSPTSRPVRGCTGSSKGTCAATRCTVMPSTSSSPANTPSRPGVAVMTRTSLPSAACRAASAATCVSMPPVLGA